jgi:hypothetical protein
MSISGVGMSDALSVAVRSVGNQYARLGRAVERIASGEGDLAENAVELKSAELAARFSIAVAKTAMDMQAHTLDLLV